MPEDAVGVGPGAGTAGDAVELNAGLGGGGLLKIGGALEEIVDRTHGELELGFAGGDALEIEDVVDQADEAIGVVEGDLEHLLHFFGAGEKGAAGDEAEGGAERGERGTELVRDGGDELVFHLVEGAALGGVGEGDDDADGFAAGFADARRVGVRVGL